MLQEARGTSALFLISELCCSMYCFVSIICCSMYCLFVCKCVLLPPGVNRIAVKYIISYICLTLTSLFRNVQIAPCVTIVCLFVPSVYSPPYMPPAVTSDLGKFMKVVCVPWCLELTILCLYFSGKCRVVCKNTWALRYVSPTLCKYTKFEVCFMLSYFDRLFCLYRLQTTKNAAC
jgi:hypothetical protein